MNTFNSILPIGMIVAALFALWFAFSKPVGRLPRWVRHAYLLLAAGLAGSAVLDYLKANHSSSSSDHSQL